MSTVQTNSKPKVRLMELMEQDNCAYCGHSSDSLIITNDGHVCCSGCRESKGNSEVSAWLRSMKTTGSVRWIKIVDNHRLNSTPIANLIRKIRIE